MKKEIKDIIDNQTWLYPEFNSIKNKKVRKLAKMSLLSNELSWKYDGKGDVENAEIYDDLYIELRNKIYSNISDKDAKIYFNIMN
jgi:hypothetical protein